MTLQNQDLRNFSTIKPWPSLCISRTNESGKLILIDLFAPYFLRIALLPLQSFPKSQFIIRHIYPDKLLTTRKKNAKAISIKDITANWVLCLEISMINMSLNG